MSKKRAAPTSMLDWEPLTERRTHTAVGKANELYLDSVLSALGPEALAEVAGLKSSELKRSKVHIKTVSRPGIHPVGVVHITNGLESNCLFAKVQRDDYRGPQNLEHESRFLSDVAPLIAAESPALRSPHPVAYYPDRGLLLMEFVRGESLKHHLFDMKLGIQTTEKYDLAQLLQYAGQWLGSLHRLTMQSSSGNPLEWLLQEFESARIKESFLRYSQKENHDGLLSILRQRLDLNPGFRRNLCQVHGEFTPIHVLVAQDAIYVVDFGNSKLGYVFEDVGRFSAFYDCLLPWRAAVGGLRIRLDTQKQLFLNGYFEQAPAAFRSADAAIMRWVRLLSFARMLGGERRDAGWREWAHSRLAVPMLRNSFTGFCRAELAAQKEMPMHTFEEEKKAEHVSSPA